jgi:hypothetical protein
VKIHNFIVKSLEQGQQHSSKKLTAQLRRKAYESGWPTDASRHLKVVSMDSKYSVSYPKKHAASIEDAEYGTQSTPPNPVVRQFIAGIKDTDSVTHFDKVLRKAGLI